MIISFKDLQKKYNNINNTLINVIAKLETDGVDECINEVIKDCADKRLFNATLNFILFDTNNLTELEHNVKTAILQYSDERNCSMRKFADRLFGVLDNTFQPYLSHPIEQLDRYFDFDELSNLILNDTTHNRSTKETLNNAITKIRILLKGSFVKDNTIYTSFLTDFEKGAIVYLLQESGYSPTIFKFVNKEFDIDIKLYDNEYVKANEDETFNKDRCELEKLFPSNDI